jgi:threonine dehydrogenase-like Zn-dependent dehydrogenase
MKAAVFAGPGEIRVVDAKLPEPRPGWVRLAIGAVGVCGTDLHLFHGKLGKVEGLQPGHEIAGTIDLVGEGVALVPGTRVAVEPQTGCGQCHHCTRGYANRCAQQRIFGVSARGGMAQYLTVPAASLHEVPSALSMSVAALAEPMAVATRGVRLANIGVGDVVAILGAGTIGLLSIPVARMAGAAEVLITARHPHQGKLARALGATRVFESSAAMLAELGPNADVVLETVGGSADTLGDSVALARAGARIVMLGVFEGDVRMPGLPFASKELTLIGSMCYARDARIGDFALATKLVVQHASAVAPLVTHRFALADIARAYATASDKTQGSVKVQVEPNGATTA